LLLSFACFLQVFNLPLCPPQALAAGGAHVIDDAGVETPGLCHVESWFTRYDGERGLMNVSPACTFTAWPRLEIGGTIQHLWDDVDDTTVGPTLKLNLQPIETGLGVGLLATGNWSVRSGHLQTAGLIVPVTAGLTERLRAHVNAGWLYGRSSQHQHVAFYGAQVEMEFAPHVTLMLEVFGRSQGLPGGQLGVRWNPGGGWFDLDLLAGRRTDGVSRDAIALGLTLRT
jgi:hypothetical protein